MTAQPPMMMMIGSVDMIFLLHDDDRQMEEETLEVCYWRPAGTEARIAGQRMRLRFTFFLQRVRVI
jgi:hypothetical protein